MIPAVLARFLAIALPAVLLAMASWSFAVEQLELAPDTAALERYGVARAAPPPTTLVLGAWLLEAMGLVALYLLIQGRSGAWWLDGLVTGWIAWLFRGPLLVLTMTALTRLPRRPFWSLAVRWWLLYPLCGLLIAGVARRLDLRR
jgi:hypothetical protein